MIANMRALIPWLILLALPAAPQDNKVIPAINEIEPWQQVGQQPYEFTWTQRAPAQRLSTSATSELA